MSGQATFGHLGFSHASSQAALLANLREGDKNRYTPTVVLKMGGRKGGILLESCQRGKEGNSLRKRGGPE